MGRAARRKKENAAYKKMLVNGVPPELAAKFASGEYKLLDQEFNPTDSSPDDVIRSIQESSAGNNMNKLQKAMATVLGFKGFN